MGQRLHQAGLRTILPWGNPTELARDQRITAALPPSAIVTPKLSITQLAGLLTGANAVVGVDTGLSHLAAALGKTTLALYTATDPGLTGVVSSARYRNLGNPSHCPSVEEVWQTGLALGAWHA